MPNDNNPLTDQELGTLFDAAIQDDPEVPVTLTAAVLADAAETAAGRYTAPPVRSPPDTPGRLIAFLSGIGGWQGAATMAASGAFGLWVGYADLSALPVVGDLGLQVDLILNGSADLDPIATFDDFMLDG